MLESDVFINLPDNEFRLLRDLISEFCGIYYDDESRYTLERRLTRRLALHGFDNFRDYYRYLLYDKGKSDELSEIIDILTVNETYFFRENNQFKALVDEIIPELKRNMSDKRKLRIWSAGCASGEEPFSIAMHLLENQHLLGAMEVEIIGSDINRRVLEKARNGVYTSNSFRGTDPIMVDKYFTRDGDDYIISDKLKKLVTFTHVNLFDPFKVRFIGEVDVIFCRNVMIYFSQDAKRKVIEGFSRTLVPGGYLLLGHAESLMNISTGFTLKHLKNDMVYQKPRRTSVTLSDEGLLDMLWGDNG